jgi:hypothetical protein
MVSALWKCHYTKQRGKDEVSFQNLFVVCTFRSLVKSRAAEKKTES